MVANSPKASSQFWRGILGGQHVAESHRLPKMRVIYFESMYLNVYPRKGANDLGDSAMEALNNS